MAKNVRMVVGRVAGLSSFARRLVGVHRVIAQRDFDFGHRERTAALPLRTPGAHLFADLL